MSTPPQMVLLNSLALELVVLCMLYSHGSGPLVVNPVKIAAAGMLSACLCLPGMLFFTSLFSPHLFRVGFVRAGRLFGRLCLCLTAPLRWAAWGVWHGCWLGGGASAAGSGLSYGVLRRRTIVEAQPSNGLSHTVALQRRQSSCQVAPCAGVPARNGDGDEEAGCAVVATASPGLVRRRSSYSHFSYASLNEHMLRHSLRRTIRMRDWRSMGTILFGWGCNWLAFLALLALFMLYSCEFQTTLGASGNAFLLSWVWSVAQRFLINEPVLIGLAKVPKSDANFLFSGFTLTRSCTHRPIHPRPGQALSALYSPLLPAPA